MEIPKINRKTQTVQNFGVNKIFCCLFLKWVSYSYQGNMYLIKNMLKTVILWNIITIYY